MAGTACKIMLQDPSSCHVLKGAWGKTSSGAGKYFPNLHAGKRSFLRMIKSAAHTALLLIVLAQTAHSATGMDKRVYSSSKEKSRAITKLEDDLEGLIIEMGEIISQQGNIFAKDEDKIRDLMDRIKELNVPDKNKEDVDTLRGLKKDLQKYQSQHRMRPASKPVPTQRQKEREDASNLNDYMYQLGYVHKKKRGFRNQVLRFWDGEESWNRILGFFHQEKIRNLIIMQFKKERNGKKIKKIITYKGYLVDLPGFNWTKETKPLRNVYEWLDDETYMKRAARFMEKFEQMDRQDTQHGCATALYGRKWLDANRDALMDANQNGHYSRFEGRCTRDESLHNYNIRERLKRLKDSLENPKKKLPRMPPPPPLRHNNSYNPVAPPPRPGTVWSSAYNVRRKPACDSNYDDIPVPPEDMDEKDPR